MPGTSPRHVVIIGGGASGTLLAIHLLRLKDAGLKITLIERQHEAGRGLAYGAAHPYHLLNIRSINMSAYSDAPSHFVEWLARQHSSGHGAEPNRFVPRLTFGTYLAEELLKTQQETQGRSSLDIVYDEAVDVSLAYGQATVTLGSGNIISASVAVVATGNEFGPQVQDPWARSPWTPLAADEARDLSPVLLHGTGLTMIDYVQALLASGFAGPIVAISRRGLLPRRHGPADYRPSLDPPSGDLRALRKWVRAQVANFDAKGQDWHGVIDGLRPHSHRLWQSLPHRDQKRFLRHLKPYWDVHRHRMAPEVATKIERLIADGRLLIIAGKIASIEQIPHPRSGVLVGVRRRGRTGISSINATKVVDCRGVVSDVAQSKNPIIEALLKRGIARPHPLELGFDVTPDCRLVAPGGRATSNVFALGPLTRGAFWESIAVPDIRVQCEWLAPIIAQSFASTGPGWPWRKASAS